MDFDPEDINIPESLTYWGLTFGIALAASLVVAFLLAAALGGKKGIPRYFDHLGEGLRDTFGMSLRRVMAISSLTVKESIRKKTLLVFVVFAILFMFAGWFLSGANANKDLQLSVHVSFVLTSIAWMVFPVALLLSCWGIPEDIRLRSLHTVVTKPVKRSEIVVGRVIGFSLVGTFVVAVMSIVGYIWILRQIPPEIAKAELISRVPIYGHLSYLDRQGQPTNKGLNTGDINEFRGYIEGATKARAIWKFENLGESSLRLNPATQEKELLMENSMQSFRTHKGGIDDLVESSEEMEALLLHGQIVLENPEKNLRVSLPQFAIREFHQNLNWIPRKISSTDEETQETKTYDLIEDLIQDDGSLIVEFRCVDAGQYIGMARPDLFVRLPEKPFASSYFKSIFGLWMMTILVIVMGVTASTFVKGPVATLLLLSVFLMGTLFQHFMEDMLAGNLKRSGLFESGIRILTHGNPEVGKEGSIEESAAIKRIDQGFTGFLKLASNAVPNFNTFSFKAYTANGFDVPLRSAILPAVFSLLGFLLPCFLLGYFSLKLRELEAK
ncbi:MAG TPA: hypothetical protein VMM56_00630 [Planctomycetaceae bacterium]|nr:hypothetical protein [Planctomycetaceae bacterium]